MEQMQTVLVVDDDEAILALMRDFLENDGFSVLTAHDAREALSLLHCSTIACIILDIMMPGQDGFALCREIRTKSDVPLLFLNARDDDVDKIRGLGLGADDYIVKTATPGEVVARVKAVLRRYGVSRTSHEAVLTFGWLRVDLLARDVRVNGKEIALTPREYDLLRLFAENPRQVFTYDHLLDRFWSGVGDKHTVRVHIARIREKIELDPEDPKFIVNVWGVGYRFEGTRK